MNHEEFESAAEYWKKKDEHNVKMERNELLHAIESYIQENNTCALATGSGSFVRFTPIEYTYHDGAFWLFTEGGQKFVALENNKNVCMAIFDKYNGFGQLRGMQISGTAEIVEPFSIEYNKAAEYKKIPIETLKKLPQPMHLLKIKADRIDYLNSDFKKNGCGSRQSIEFHN